MAEKQSSLPYPELGENNYLNNGFDGFLRRDSYDLTKEFPLSEQSQLGLGKLASSDVTLGDLATEDSVAWGSVTDDGNKPENDADVTSTHTSASTNGVVAGVDVVTSASANTGMKMGSTYTGAYVYGDTFDLYNTSGTLMGWIYGSSSSLDVYASGCGLSLLGGTTVSITAAGGNVTIGASTNIVEIGAGDSLLPVTDNTGDLGGSSNEWKDLYIDGTAYIDKLSLSITAGEGVTSSILPSVTNTLGLGASSYIWSNIYTNDIDVDGTAQVDALRIDQTPTAETPSATHTITINCNGTNYKFLCLAV